MKKKIILGIILTLSLVCVAPIVGLSDDNKEIETIEAESIMSTELQSETNIEETETIEEIKEPTIEEIASAEYIAHMEKLNSCEDHKQWFLDYKTLMDKYSNELDEVETIYDWFSKEDLQLLFNVVEAEVGDYGFDEKCNVASVIFNRIDNENFGDTLSTVLISSQFTTIRNGRYKRVTPSEETILACEYAFSIEETADGALFFEGGKSKVHSAYAKYLFTDKSGHKFYK